MTTLQLISICELKLLIRFSEILARSEQDQNLKRGFLVDTSILFAASYEPDLFNSPAEEMFEFCADLGIPLYTNVNIRAEFIDLQRRVIIPEALSDLYSQAGASFDLFIQSKLKSVSSSLAAARTTGKPYKFSEQQIKDWRKSLRQYPAGSADAWEVFCNDYIRRQIEVIWDATCEELGVRFISTRSADKEPLLKEKLSWDEMATYVGRFGIGSFDAMIINLFANSELSGLITADRDLVYALSKLGLTDKFVIVPDQL